MTATVTNLRSSTNADEELVHLHPDEIVLEPNARTTVDPVELAELTESLREHGVLLAIKAIRYADGTIRVRDGQRRVFSRKRPCCVGVCWRTSRNFCPRPTPQRRTTACGSLNSLLSEEPFGLLHWQ